MKNFVKFLVVSLTILFSQACSKAPQETSEVKSPLYVNSVFMIKSLRTGKCLDVADFSRENGGRIHQWDCTGADNQLFRLGDQNKTQIVSVFSGKCLDVSGMSYDNGAPVVQWDCVGVPNQLANLGVLPDRREEYFVIFEHSKKCLDVDGDGNGVQLKTYDCHYGRNQAFDFVYVRP